MLKKEISSIISFYAVSPIHAGSGASVATVDLPIQRERHTGYPIIQASGVKGAMRDHFRKFNTESDKMLINYIFGSDEQDDWDKKEDALPGSISVSDAKLLAFPMRSNVAPFVWVTSPTVMNRLKKDLEFVGLSMDGAFKVDNDEALVLEGDFTEYSKIILEDAVVKVVSEKPNQVPFIKQNLPGIDRLLLISDIMFDYCVSYCTEVQTNIKIDSETGTASDHALRYQEFLPADSILYSVVYFSGSIKEDLKASAIRDYLKGTIKDFIQVGGDTTLGKGIFKVNWIGGEQ